MDQVQKLRIKTAMIIYELESSLGSYILKNEILENIPDANKESIVCREILRGNHFTKNDINSIIEASYLDEIFDIAIKITDGTILNRYMVQLKQLCTYLDIFAIRNAVSHPNRGFPDFYWFRAATIASDPLIEKLGLLNIRKALKHAVEENLCIPPDEWISDVNWAIPNTLPSSFDHEITGLLGRDKEFNELEIVLSKERNNLIAIVAPGGIGKTALVLQFLRSIALSPEWNNKLTSILFCTLKNEQLTASGIEKIEAINGIDQIKTSILKALKTTYNKPDIKNFDEASEILAEEKVLICIDNLETLLVESQKEFIEFNQSLPLKWRVLVTSRISIDSATTVPLEPLVKRHAVNLCRNYLRKRGVSDIALENIEKIAVAANYNPLAIRLTVDLYIKGGDISQSINKSQKNIASFSYKNLIESLSDNSISILEAIYSLTNSTKSDLIDFLSLSNEDITESINELSKTSLIFRSSNEFGNDEYKLSESIRDLLLINPKNIEIRNRIAENLKQRKTKIVEQRARMKQLNISEFDDEYIPDDIEHSLYSLLADFIKLLGRFKKRNSTFHNELILIKYRFDELITGRQNDHVFLYFYSRIFKELKDTVNELSYLKKANNIKNTYRVNLAIAKWYFYNKDYEVAAEYFKELIQKGLDDPSKSSQTFGYQITKLCFLCLLYDGLYDEIINITADWSNDVYWKNLKGVSRATALKRKAEYKAENISVKESIITEVFDIYNEIFKTENYPEFACTEANKIVKDSIFNSQFNNSEKIKRLHLNFVANHFFSIISNLKSENINSDENQIFINKLYNIEISRNPLHNVKWYTLAENDIYDTEHIAELINDKYIIVTVYHIPEDAGYGMSKFMFAEDENKMQYYLSVTNFEGGWNKWGYIKENDKLAVVVKCYAINGKPTPAVKIVEIDKY